MSNYVRTLNALKRFNCPQKVLYLLLCHVSHSLQHHLENAAVTSDILPVNRRSLFFD